MISDAADKKDGEINRNAWLLWRRSNRMLSMWFPFPRVYLIALESICTFIKMPENRCWPWRKKQGNDNKNSYLKFVCFSFYFTSSRRSLYFRIYTHTESTSISFLLGGSSFALWETHRMEAESVCVLKLFFFFLLNQTPDSFPKAF